ncbi:hypothetical protein [Paenarthrobacter nitroguajacolicus]|nr:hypothetical protein [Paenarthrobacter nitroguajacolicus]
MSSISLRGHRSEPLGALLREVLNSSGEHIVAMTIIEEDRRPTPWKRA